MEPLGLQYALRLPQPTTATRARQHLHTRMPPLHARMQSPYARYSPAQHTPLSTLSLSRIPLPYLSPRSLQHGAHPKRAAGPRSPFPFPFPFPFAAAFAAAPLETNLPAS
eukprot:2011296-Rhodomonas_salina.1